MIRACALNGNGFRHDGLEVGERWAPLDPKLSDAGRSTLRDFHGRFIQVHPEDLKKLPAELGLEYVDLSSPLNDLKAEATKAKADEKSTTKTASKSDAKKEG